MPTYRAASKTGLTPVRAFASTLLLACLGLAPLAVAANDTTAARATPDKLRTHGAPPPSGSLAHPAAISTRTRTVSEMIPDLHCISPCFSNLNTHIDPEQKTLLKVQKPFGINRRVTLFSYQSESTTIELDRKGLRMPLVVGYREGAFYADLKTKSVGKDMEFGFGYRLNHALALSQKSTQATLGCSGNRHNQFCGVSIGMAME